MLVSQIINIRWLKNNKNYYESKGYKFTKINDIFVVNTEDLQESCSIKVKIKCDYCGTEIEKPYSVYIKSKDNVITKDCCFNCRHLKFEETSMLKYGCTNTSKLERVKEKTKKTNLEKYGTEYVLQNKKIRKKIKSTNLKKYGKTCNLQTKEIKDLIKNKYGTEHVLQNEEIKKKVEKTNLEKYGVKNPSQIKEVKEKMKQTNLKKYGVEYASQNEKIKHNIIKNGRVTMYKNGTCPTSKQQKYLYDLLGGKLNYPVDKCSLDIAYPKEKIYVEYDGSGHNLNVRLNQITNDLFNTKQIERFYFLKNKGWKLIRIVSKNDILLGDNDIIKLINGCKEYLKQGHSWIEVNIDENKIKCSQYEKEILE